jgi:hypothetical protein
MEKGNQPDIITENTESETKTPIKKFFKYVPISSIKIFHESTAHPEKSPREVPSNNSSQILKSPKRSPSQSSDRSPRKSDSKRHSHSHSKSSDHHEGTTPFSQKITDFFCRSRENSVDKSIDKSAERRLSTAERRLSTTSPDVSDFHTIRSKSLSGSSSNVIPKRQSINSSAETYEIELIDSYNISYNKDDTSTYSTFYIIRSIHLKNETNKINIIIAGMLHKMDSYALVNQNYIGKCVFYDMHKHLCVERRMSEEDEMAQLYLLYSKEWDFNSIFDHYPVYVICHQFEITTIDFIRIYPQLIAHIQNNIIKPL